jgi:hypothetical protein
MEKKKEKDFTVFTMILRDEYVKKISNFYSTFNNGKVVSKSKMIRYMVDVLSKFYPTF